MKVHYSANVLGRLATSKRMQIAALIFAVTASALIAVLAIFYSARAATATTVRPADIRPIAEVATGPAGWYKEATGTGNIEISTDKPYNVAGSLKFTVNDSLSYAELANYKELPSGDKLATIQGLAYATWQQVDNTKAVSLQIGVDTDVTDSDVTWQGRLVYEPYLNTSFAGEPVTDGKWQTWVTWKPGSQWWMTWSPSLTAKYGPNPCPQMSPCDYAEVLSTFPNIGFNAGFGNPLILKAGSGWPSFVGYADVPSYTQSVTAMDHFWDFEPAVVTPTTPTSKDQCKETGWQAFGSLFKNQGECVAWANKNL